MSTSVMPNRPPVPVCFCFQNVTNVPKTERLRKPGNTSARRCFGYGRFEASAKTSSIVCATESAMYLFAVAWRHGRAYCLGACPRGG
jgi:hypothetical protein